MHNDPTGHCADGLTTILCAAVAGAIMGAAVSYATQVYSNIQAGGLSVSALTNVDGKAIGTAAVAGAVAGATGAVVAVAAVALGAVGLAGTVAAGVVGGAASGTASRAVTNMMYGNSWNEGITAQTVLTDGLIGGLTAGVTYKLQMLNKAPTSCAVNSFEENTVVPTSRGEIAIGSIVIGDYVLAWNEEDGEVGYYEVVDAFHHTDKVVTELIVGGEWIETTPEHPFYVEGKGWVLAEDLEIGDQIRKSDGTTGAVWLK